jgi:leader peptidase (prepilin peptidase)/N-methyltransferase
VWHIRCVPETTLFAAIAFPFGLCIGSFLNVCIRRIPAGKSIVWPASACPRCGAAIRPWDNIPLLSWVLLAGKCRACRAPISPVYPAVELLTGLAFAACVWRFGLTAEAAKWAFFLGALLVLFFTDIFYRVLPDEVNFGAAAAGLIFSLLVPVGDGSAEWLAAQVTNLALPWRLLSLLDALLALALGSLLLWGFAEAFSLVIGRPAMGFGDVKMMLALGAFLGLRKTFVAVLLGTVLGSLLGLLIILALHASGWRLAAAQRAARMGRGSVAALRWQFARRYQLPLGTFLAVGGAAAVFLGPALVRWYGSFLQ